MYTNPFSRSHCTVRQVIDKFLHIDDSRKKFRKNDRFERSFSNKSTTSTGSSTARFELTSKIGQKLGKV
ncbi:hypothetical protein WA026_023537 [Henosepilachna vigintioctopunctata]|uniref:Uncharacterized protein n=1 Tax=Henosepilachna vigintioctopunctata TaxID=420089 RepID=A0AAW1UNV7_9CUCU